MEYIEGETIADNLIAEKYSDLDKEKITESFISTLAELHFFDVEKKERKKKKRINLKDIFIIRLLLFIVVFFML